MIQLTADMARVEYELLNGNKYQPILFEESSIHSFILRLPKEEKIEPYEVRFIDLDIKFFLPLYLQYALITSFHTLEPQLRTTNSVHKAEMGNDSIGILCENTVHHPLYLVKGFRIALIILPNPATRIYMYESK